MSRLVKGEPEVTPRVMPIRTLHSSKEQQRQWCVSA